MSIKYTRKLFKYLKMWYNKKRYIINLELRQAMKIINITRNSFVSDNCLMAATFFARFKGLMGKKIFKDGDALIIKPCNSIHTFFMNFPIDVIFVDNDWKAIYMMESFIPWKLSKIIPRSRAVIELPPGTIQKSGSSLGDVFCIDYS